MVKKYQKKRNFFQKHTDICRFFVRYIVEGNLGRYTNLIIFTDDGISGVTMNRPGFQDMISKIDQVSAVFVKDLSRPGRNYIEVGKLTEEFFPDHDIRLVAVSDGIDTAEGENELAPIHYHVIGPIAIPDNLPVPDITMDTRKGVKVTYQP